MKYLLQWAHMIPRLGLLEYLAQPVKWLALAGTRATFTDGETYDDDPGLDPLGIPSSVSTRITRTDGETYDDDPGLGGLTYLI